MPKAFCHWSSKFGCVLQEFLIFIRCLVRIPMFGGIFVFQGLIMERYNDISLNSRSVSHWVRALSLLRLSFPVTKLLSMVIWGTNYCVNYPLHFPVFFCFCFFFAKRLLSNKGLRYFASLREKKYNHALPFLNIINPLFLSTPYSSTSLGALLEGFRLHVLTHVVLPGPYHLHEPLVLLQLT